MESDRRGDEMSDESDEDQLPKVKEIVVDGFRLKKCTVRVKRQEYLDAAAMSGQTTIDLTNWSRRPKLKKKYKCPTCSKAILKKQKRPELYSCYCFLTAFQLLYYRCILPTIAFLITSRPIRARRTTNATTAER